MLLNLYFARHARRYRRRLPHGSATTAAETEQPVYERNALRDFFEQYELMMSAEQMSCVLPQSGGRQMRSTDGHIQRCMPMFQHRFGRFVSMARLHAKLLVPNWLLTVAFMLMCFLSAANEDDDADDGEAATRAPIGGGRIRMRGGGTANAESWEQATAAMRNKTLATTGRRFSSAELRRMRNVTNI